ncbi:MAG TPA: hypothetical protein VMX13_17565 [Sedimentisphaerales bacterium]|nr:hypothetical protein [Sedimentisphaerales bacterium]
MTTRRKYAPPVVTARLAFEKVLLTVKELSGEVRPLKRRGDAIGCGDSVDVMWFRDQVLFMKEKGLFEQVLVAGNTPFSDLEWDGRNIWVSIPQKGVWILDTSGQIVAEVGSKDGLPPGENGLLLHTVGPGRMFAVGSFGPRDRGWCAIVEYKNGKPSINVFHEARRVPSKLDEKDEKKEIRHDPYVVFRPCRISECLAFTQDFDPNIVYYKHYSVRSHQAGGRRTLFIHRCKTKLSEHTFIYPLEVDLDTLDVRVASQKSISLVSSDPGLDYEGKTYFPGKVWYCMDPNTRRKEKLVTRGQLPDPYGSLGGYWVSAHYGLAGWTADRQLYQIRVTDEENDMTPPPPGEDKYYHVLVFEDANGSKPQGIRSVRLEIHRQGQPTLKYPAGISGRSGYYPVGRYEASGTTTISEGKRRKEVKVCDFEPIEVTKDSPVRLVFRTKPAKTPDTVETGPVTAAVSAKVAVQPPPTVVPSLDANNIKQEGVKKDDIILYTGQVVHAITGEPMAGAFVMTRRSGNLAWITPEEWKQLHKLPINPSLGDEALWPIKNISSSKLPQIVRTDANGGFEMRLSRASRLQELVAFEENFLSTALWHRHFGPAEDGRVEVPPIPIFPAAKIKVTPFVDVDPFAEPSMFVIPAHLRPRLIIDEDKNPSWVATFSSMYGSSISKPQLEMGQPQAFYVPAESRLGILLEVSQDYFYAAGVLEITNLKHGEILDLGLQEFKRTMKIVLKVLDSADEPVVGRKLRKHPDGFSYNIDPHKTNKEGLTTFYVRPNSEAKFDVLCTCPGEHIVKTVEFKIGGREDEGKDFTIQL